MRVLLDGMLDQRLRRFLSEDIEAVTVREHGWGSKKNGELIALAEKEFDVLLAADRGIPHQQGLSRYDLAVVILEARSNRLVDLAPLMDRMNERVRTVRPGSTSHVEERTSEPYS